MGSLTVMDECDIVMTGQNSCLWEGIYFIGKPGTFAEKILG